MMNPNLNNLGSISSIFLFNSSKSNEESDLDSVSSEELRNIIMKGNAKANISSIQDEEEE